MTEEQSEREDKILKLARKQWRNELIDIVDGEDVSEGDDNGAYVRAWLWVDFAGTEFDKDEEGATDDE